MKYPQDGWSLTRNETKYSHWCVRIGHKLTKNGYYSSLIKKCFHDNTHGGRRAAKKAAITFGNKTENLLNYKVALYLRTGDFFYGEIVLDEMKIKTSYGLFKIKKNEIALIEFEGAGKVTTSVNTKNGNQVKGIIQNDYLPIKLLNGQIIQIVPDKINRITVK
jgi:hypothetical protein